jgi:hypothetical protein
LKRGQRTWILLRHHWHGEENLEPSAIRLESGAYHLSVEFIQHPPEFLRENELYEQQTGFEIKYRAPTRTRSSQPFATLTLFRTHKDQPLLVPGLAGLRRTFSATATPARSAIFAAPNQRAFKALLFTHRFRLSAHEHAGEGSELGYMLSKAITSQGGRITATPELSPPIRPISISICCLSAIVSLAGRR